MGSSDRGGEEVVAPSEGVVLTQGVQQRQRSGIHNLNHLLADHDPSPEEKKREAERVARDRETTQRAQYHFSHSAILDHILQRMNDVARTEGRGITFRLPTNEEGGDDHTVVFSPAALQSRMGTFSVSGRMVGHSRLDGHNGQLHVVFFTAQLQVYEFLGIKDLVDLMVERFEVRPSQAAGAHVWDYNSDADSRTAYRVSHAPAPKQTGKS